MVCVYSNHLNLGNITIYCPPICPKNKFDEIISKAKDWIMYLENHKQSLRIIINSDLNFPYMNDWSGTVTDTLFEFIESRKLVGKAVSADKEQALDLYNLTCESFMTQCIDIQQEKQIFSIYASQMIMI